MSVNLFNRNEQPEKTVAQIKEVDPDIIAFQEYTRSWHRTLHEALGDAYPHVLTIERPDSFGAAFYSRIPIFPPERSERRIGSPADRHGHRAGPVKGSGSPSSASGAEVVGRNR
jgi:endonuclease/exonuclease/phosphatase (EEP) superfamily protein YafD